MFIYFNPLCVQKHITCLCYITSQYKSCLKPCEQRRKTWVKFAHLCHFAPGVSKTSIGMCNKLVANNFNLGEFPEYQIMYSISCVTKMIKSLINGFVSLNLTINPNATHFKMQFAITYIPLFQSKISFIFESVHYR